MTSRAVLAICLVPMLSHRCPGAQEPNYSKLVRPGPDGKLTYSPFSDRGDVLPDFSHCGYRGGGVPLPEVEVKATLSPRADSEDDLPRLQAALDELAELPVDDAGLRGALLLKRGRYRLNGTLRLAASGVVLRGEGEGEDGTVLVATLRKQHTLIKIVGEGSAKEIGGTRQTITDEYVPVGARTFHVADASAFAAGDQVIVHRPSTAEWLRVLGMDRIREQHSKVVQWRPGSKDLRFLRTVVAVDGNTVTIDAPLVNALQREFGGGSIYKYEYPGRFEQVGIESLRCESEYAKKDDEQHGWNAITFSAVRDAWARNVTSRYFGYSCVGVTRTASRVTVQDCKCLDPVSRVAGGRRYSFHISGQQSLVQRCYARSGRHDFVMHSVVPGPNVFLDCEADNARSDSGPHHRWATGTLYDNVVINGNALDVEDRQWSGTGHGWAGALMVFWNCTAKSIICQQPPTTQNFALGCLGAKAQGHYVKTHPDGWWESHGQPVAPRSLYLKQLEDRRGSEAVEAISQ